ncbi:unnamed protein product [Meloidogyne enterolobii]|uniref:Uncharacterized protein n=1 Tax=Meloidogyne enterolobii TaxID=390850 RepID=A0ACB0Y101_MELEN
MRWFLLNCGYRLIPELHTFSNLVLSANILCPQKFVRNFRKVYPLILGVTEHRRQQQQKSTTSFQTVLEKRRQQELEKRSSKPPPTEQINKVSTPKRIIRVFVFVCYFFYLSFLLFFLEFFGFPILLNL